MRDSSTSPARRRLRRIAVALAFATGLLAIYSCSLIVETNGTQCTQDSDCAALQPGATCNKATNVCVGPSSASSSSSSSSGSGGPTSCYLDGGADAGCYNVGPKCPLDPTDPTSQILNACESTVCFHFDNSTLTKLGPGGSLPPLPNPGPVNGM